MNTSKLKWISLIGFLSALLVVTLGITKTTLYNKKEHSLPYLLKSVVDVLPGDAYCSGWVKRGTHEVVTAAHCAEGLNDTDIINVDFGDGKEHPFHIRKKGDMALVVGPDLMTLYTNDQTIKWPDGFEVCKFAPYYGEAIILMGGPLSFSKSLEYGYVANPSVDVNQSISDDSKFAKSLIEFNGEMWPGNSGGPALDQREGCVIGAGELVKTINIGFISVPVGVNFLTPMSDLEKVDGV